MQFEGKTKEYLRLEEISEGNCYVLKESNFKELSLLWFTEDDNELIIDGKEYIFSKNQIVCVTEFHKIQIKKIAQARLVRFNRPFYCVLEHDSEVGCKGVLFFGASNLPIITLPYEKLEKFEILWKMFCMELQSKDNLQIEMLQIMLKRLLIICTRLYKEQYKLIGLAPKNLDIVREFNYLVEVHFKTKHTVAEYADLLNKSPKTLSNTFSKLKQKSPLKYIQERRMIEARRLLRYSDLLVKEIANEIGFEDIQTFSRFFKKNEGVSPMEFKEKVVV